MLGEIFRTLMTAFLVGKDNAVIAPVIQKIDNQESITAKEAAAAIKAVRKWKATAKFDGADNLDQFDEVEERIFNYPNVVSTSK